MILARRISSSLKSPRLNAVWHNVQTAFPVINDDISSIEEVAQNQKIIEHTIGVVPVPVTAINHMEIGRAISLPIAIYTTNDILVAQRISAILPSISASADPPTMIGQAFFKYSDPADYESVKALVISNKAELISLIESNHFHDSHDPAIKAHSERIFRHVQRGGKVCDLFVEQVDDGIAVINVQLTTLDAMGATLAISAAELASRITRHHYAPRWTPIMNILSNDGRGRLATARLVISQELSDHLTSGNTIQQATQIAGRAVSRLGQALSQDWRGQDAAFHLCTATESLFLFRNVGDRVELTLSLPVVFGTIGHVKRFKTASDIFAQLGQPSAQKMAEIAVKVSMGHVIDFLENGSKYRYDSIPATENSRLTDPRTALDLGSKKFKDLSIDERHRVLFGVYRPELVNKEVYRESAGRDGAAPLPLAVIPEVLINGVMNHIPCALEEPSVVAAANRSRKITNDSGGISAHISKTESGYDVQIVVPFLKKALSQDKGLPEDIVDRFALAVRCAESTNLRAVTSNKGCDNLLGPVALAYGWDPFLFSSQFYSQAVESGRLHPIFNWTRTKDGLIGKFDGHISINELHTAFGSPHHQIVRELSGFNSESEAILTIISAGILVQFGSISGLVSGTGMEGHMKLYKPEGTRDV